MLNKDLVISSVVYFLDQLPSKPSDEVVKDWKVKNGKRLNIISDVILSKRREARVTNSSRLFTPGKHSKLSGIKSSSTNHGRMAMFDQRLVIGGHLTDLKNTGGVERFFILNQPGFNL